MTIQTKKINTKLVRNNIDTPLEVSRSLFTTALEEKLSTSFGLANSDTVGLPLGKHLITGSTSIASLNSNLTGAVAFPIDRAPVLFPESIVTESIVTAPAYSFTDDMLVVMYESIVSQQSNILSGTLWDAEALSTTKLKLVEDVNLYYSFNYEGLTWKDFLPRITRFVKDVVRNFKKLFEVAVYWLSHLAKIFFVQSKPTVLLA